jgi:2,4-dienoyl-CoA reductase-like NADH-dependent reductase (Old Yellow Enzyme family)
VPLAAVVKKASSIAVQVVGMIVSPHQAEAIIADNQVDFVALAPGFRDDPRWSGHAAPALVADAINPPYHRRARPEHWPGAASARAQPSGE